MLHLAYRRDIDGLRAIAVLSVLVFHVFPWRLPGGFVGVDIFFVISGFLISGNIFKNVEQGRFSYLDFYARRIRRIFPALVVVLGCCLIFAWFAALPDELRLLGRHLSAGSLFLSNIQLWQESGYFDVAAHNKPLLHLWSLGIEEQFYLVWPVVVLVFWVWQRRFWWLLWALIAVSFTLNVMWVEKDAQAAFFLPFSRFWELMCGAALAYASAHNSAAGITSDPGMQLLPWTRRIQIELAAAAGLALIIFALFATSASSAFPGWWALPPVLGACLLIGAGPSAWLNRWILSNPLSVLIGLISFPLYLWHWPILTFYRLAEGDLSRASRLQIMALSIFLAWVTWRLVEIPLRFRWRSAVVPIGLCVSMALIGALGWGLWRSDGIPGRLHMDSTQIAMVRDLSDVPARFDADNCPKPLGESADDATFCRVSSGRTPDALIWGDSHAAHWFDGMAYAVPGSNWVLAANAACPPLLGINFEGKVLHCSERNARILAYVMEHPEIHTVVLSFFSGYFNDKSFAGDHVLNGDGPEIFHMSIPEREGSSRLDVLEAGLGNTVDALLAANRRVLIIADVPELPFFPKDCLVRPLRPVQRSSCAVAQTEVSVRQQHVREKLAEVMSSRPSVRLLDPLPGLCREGQCLAINEGVMLYRDSHHLSVRGSVREAMAFAQQFSASPLAQGAAP